MRITAHPAPGELLLVVGDGDGASPFTLRLPPDIAAEVARRINECEAAERRAELVELRDDLLARSLRIISDAICCGMPVTEEVADVRNSIAVILRCESKWNRYLRSRRIAAGYGMREFAEHIGILPSAYCAIESGRQATEFERERIEDGLSAGK